MTLSQRIRAAALGPGTVQLPKMDGHEVCQGIYLIGEPTPVLGTDKMRCLANVGGALALVELRLKFAEVEKPQ